MKQKEPKPTELTQAGAYAQADKYKKAMHLRFQNKYSGKEIAKMCGVSYHRYRVWFMKGGPLHDRYEVFCQEALSLVPGLEVKSVAERITDEAPNSLDTIVKIRDKKDVNPATRYIAAKDLLDRAGFAPVQKTANVHIVEEMSADELNRTFQTFLDAAKNRKKNNQKSGS